MKTNHNRNYQRIDNAIVNAYKELLKEKGSPDSSITELCQKAKVNRTTFYKHYRGIYEITNKIEEELVYSIFNLNPGDDMGVANFLTNPQPVLDTLSKNLLQNIDYYKNTFRPERLHYIINKIANLLIIDFKNNFPKYAKKEETMLKVKLNITNLVGSFATLYIQWLNGHLNCELKDINDYLGKVISKLYKYAKMPE